MNRFCAQVRVLLIVVAAIAAFASRLQAQVDEAREAMRGGDYALAAAILSASVEQNPSADAYLYLGIAYAHLKNSARAEETLREGAGKYPRDPRFHNELAGVYMSRNDVESARAALHDALGIDPKNAYAADLLVNIDLAQGNVRAALQAWGSNGDPVITRILNNGRSLDVSPWTVEKALAFETGSTLKYPQWRTTERRLLESGPFAGVNLEMQPTPEIGRYAANIATTFRQSTRFSKIDILKEYLSWAFTRFLYLDRWDLGGSGVSLNGSLRPGPSRWRGELRILAPLPLPGGIVAEAAGVWRDERWDLSRITREALPRTAFRHKSTGWRVMLKAIPDYRFEVAAGFEFTNRSLTGDPSEPFADSRNSGKVLMEANVQLADRDYQSRVRVQAFAARKSIMGDMDYSGGTVELNNRLSTPKTKDSTIDWTIKAGTSRGKLPTDEYFVLGADLNAANLMRGHSAFDKRKRSYGAAPMGTDFLLANVAIDRRLRARTRSNPLFPSVTVKAEAFMDIGKVFDRARVFRQGQLLVDAGAGLKIETETHAFHVILGHSLRDRNSFGGMYIEKRW